MTNIQIVQEIYAAFGRGDIPAILERLSDDIDWEYGASPSAVPWLQPQRGRAGVGQFFASLAGLSFQRFEVTQLLEAPGLVVALVALEATALTTGKRIVEEDEVHIWRFDAVGRVCRFRHRVDTAQHAAALQG